MARECMVCLEETTEFVEFSCKHEVCVLCFPKILFANPECPLCRARLYKPEPPQRNWCGLCAVGGALTGLLFYILITVDRYRVT